MPCACLGDANQDAQSYGTLIASFYFRGNFNYTPIVFAATLVGMRRLSPIGGTVAESHHCGPLSTRQPSMLS